MATGKWFTQAVLGQYNAGREVDWLNDTVKVVLTTDTYTPNQDSHTYITEVTGEVTDPSYHRITLQGKSITWENESREIRFMSTTNPKWENASFTARWAVIYIEKPQGGDDGDPSNDIVLGYVDFGGNQTVVSGTFTVTWDATGVLKHAVL